MNGVKMRTKNQIFFLFLFFSSLIYGQGATTTTSSAEKYNRRGYFKNDAMSKSNHEIISDYDGNLMLYYSTPVNIPHDLGSDFTITYNPNVEHRIFAPLLNNSSTGGNIYYYNAGIPLNSAEWILGYKGFALQTLNFETFHYADQSISKPEYVKKEVPLLIPGYHYGNFDGAFNSSEWGSVYRDYITILKADGSKMVLRNAEYFYGGTQGSGSTAYTGLYVEEGNESKGYAIVTFDAGDGSPVERRKRIIEYRPGDGLVYTFEERLCSFSDPSYVTNKKIIYLMKISNPVYKADDGFIPKVTFNYSNTLSIIGGTLNIYNRMIFLGMTYSPHLSSAISQIDMDWTYNTSGYFTGIKTVNHAKGESIKLSVDGLSFNNALSYYRHAVKGRSIYPTKIQLLGETSTTVVKEDVLTYDLNAYSKPANSRKYYYYSNLGANFYYQDSTYLPKSIVYQSKQKSEFEFWPSSFDGNTYVVQLAMGEQFCLENMNKAKRDCYTNYMIKGRKTYNYIINAYVQTRHENYTYSKGPNNSFLAKNGVNYSDNLAGTLRTTIDIISDQTANAEGPTDAASKQIRKYFYFFPTSFTNYSANFDVSKTSKLIKEVVYYSTMDSLAKEYTYDWGNYTSYPEYSGWSYFDGSFAQKSVKETEYKGGYSAAYFNSKNYSYNTIYYGGTSFSKSIINYEISKDTSTMYNYKKYYNVINISSPPGTVTYTNSYYPDYYKIGLPLVDKIYGKTTPSSSENVISQRSYSYSTSTCQNGSNWEIKNLLHQITDNDQSTRKNYTYLWYNSVTGTSSYASNSLRVVRLLANGYPAWPLAGSLRQTDYPKGTTENLNYIRFSFEETPPVIGIVVPYTGSNYNVNKIPVTKQWMPWQKTIAFDNTSLTTTTSYDAAGNLEAEIDINGYFQGYKYDDIQRMTTAAFPGSFYAYAPDEPNPMNNTAGSVNYTYYDNHNKIHGLSNMDLGSGKSFEFEDQYDALGNMLDKYEKNDSNILEKVTSKSYNGFDLLVKEIVYAAGTSQYINRFSGYDYLGRITAVQTGNAAQTYTYNLTPGSFSRSGYTVNYVRSNTVADAEGKSVVTYLDNTGKKVAEQIGTNSPTLFLYNEAYQLTSVVTPEGKVTSYTYDELGFLTSKTSPDEGTYNYKYSKYGELRYQFHTTQTPATLLFHNYDKLGRLQVTGTRSINQGQFNSLNPDVNSADDNSASNMILVNVYDDISGLSSAYYSAVFSGFSLPAGVTLNNIKGKLAITAYRNTTSSSWSYKAYSYNPQGQVEKEYLKENIN